MAKISKGKFRRLRWIYRTWDPLFFVNKDGVPCIGYRGLTLVNAQIHGPVGLPGLPRLDPIQFTTIQV